MPEANPHARDSREPAFNHRHSKKKSRGNGLPFTLFSNSSIFPFFHTDQDIQSGSSLSLEGCFVMILVVIALIFTSGESSIALHYCDQRLRENSLVGGQGVSEWCLYEVSWQIRMLYKIGWLLFNPHSRSTTS